MSYLDGQTNEYFSSKSSSAFHSLKVHLTAYTHFRFGPEKLAGAKLMASLMESEDVILEHIF
ncbi:hypothetical protein HID58_060777 [Brassica napus]|uniref:Uncharacterized protein n=1 Tax=Brassica napus TaxID=3708 RepID=A0ABQ7ZWP6_BRANA|nr:hypothetical protein HID58_060777 [Brassica napus]